MKNFEKFEHRKYKAYTKESITITKVGMFNFSVATMVHYVKEYNYAILYFNKSDMLIGVELTNTESSEAYKIKKSRNGKFGSISGMAFLKYYGIPHERTNHYQVKWDEDEKMIILDLNKQKND